MALCKHSHRCVRVEEILTISRYHFDNVVTFVILFMNISFVLNKTEGIRNYFWIKHANSHVQHQMWFSSAVNCLASECIPTGNIPVPWGHKCDVIYWGSPSVCDTGFAISWKRQGGTNKDDKTWSNWIGSCEDRHKWWMKFCAVAWWSRNKVQGNRKALSNGLWSTEWEKNPSNQDM